MKTTIIQNIFRVLLGSIMLYIGIAHLSFRRIEFQAQVPTWLTTNEGMMDLIVLISGYIEIAFGILMILGGKLKVKTGIALGIFYILIFPGNINQYINEIDSLRLDSDNKRLIRLFFQPLLVLWAFWSSGSLEYLKRKFK
ncbi:hypothetical protein OAR38_00200 [Flavobacteriaceae bacterium]|jgi:uncharacterized membrane protein|nr:hypothetical protein [Flavobacteriaceae bacterium]MDA9242422.1 hypothetical protein [Flavobacteriaceae bacterium]MDB4014427.1 hypothetical protein [Flavobacteriaceae bacterium]MDB9787612.1 hypothetical protein [Flavobacteriaceae bacterium]MDB9902034.1 hypothetical protein [Flavobacteriaceae bacterium]